jgi:hypothetical protein
MSRPSMSALGVAARSLAQVAFAYTGAHIPVSVVRSWLFRMLGYVTELYRSLCLPSISMRTDVQRFI